MLRSHFALSTFHIALFLTAGCSVDGSLALDAPETVADTGATTPSVARDPGSGGSLVAWVRTAGGESNVYLARTDGNGVRIGEPVRVNHLPGDASTHEQAPPQVAVGSGGEIYVAWQKSRTAEGRMYDASDLRFSWSTDGGRTFAPALTVNDDAGGPPSSHTFHNVAVAADGTVYVSWLDGREQDRVRAELAAAGATAGQAHAHSDARLPGSDVRVASWRPGDAVFGPATVVDGNVCPCCRTSLAVAPDGTVYVAWRKVFEGNVRDAVVARSSDGGRTFSAPVAVHRDGWVFEGCPHAGPSLALDAEGRLFAAWYTGKEGAQGLYYAVSTDGGASFGEPEALLRDEWVPPSQVKLSATADGVLAAWDDRREEGGLVRLARLDAEGVRPLGDPLPGHSPALAAGPDAASVVWQHGSALRTVAVR